MLLAIDLISPGVGGLIAQIMSDLDPFQSFLTLHQDRVDKERENK
jgi:hypothetical protein